MYWYSKQVKNNIVTGKVYWSIIHNQVYRVFVFAVLFVFHLFLLIINIVCVVLSWSTGIPLLVRTSCCCIPRWIRIHGSDWSVPRHPSNDVSGCIAVLCWSADRLVISDDVTCRQYSGYDRCIVGYYSNTRHCQTVEWTSCPNGSLYGFRWVREGD